MQTRQEILQEESASISKNISKLTAKMTKEKQQIDSISKEEENIQSRIQTLQQQCQALGEHRREYERNYDELENQSESEKKRLVLVKNSLKSVQEQIEKVSKCYTLGSDCLYYVRMKVCQQYDRHVSAGYQTRNILSCLSKYSIVAGEEMVFACCFYIHEYKYKNYHVFIDIY